MICLDASVVGKLFLEEAHTQATRRLYASQIRAGEPVIAPPIMPFEVANTLRQRVRRREASVADADQLLANFLAYPIEIVWERRLHRSAFAVADQFRIDAYYDACYVALALDNECDFWTDDRKLLDRIDGRLSSVRWIGELAVPDDEA